MLQNNWVKWLGILIKKEVIIKWIDGGIQGRDGNHSDSGDIGRGD